MPRGVFFERVRSGKYRALEGGDWLGVSDDAKARPLRAHARAPRAQVPLKDAPYLFETLESCAQWWRSQPLLCVPRRLEACSTRQRAAHAPAAPCADARRAGAGSCAPPPPSPPVLTEHVSSLPSRTN